MFALDTPRDRGRPPRSVIRWIFDPNLARSVGFGPVSGPLCGPHAYGIDRAPRPVQLASRSEIVKDHAVEPGPDPVPAPLDHAARARGGLQDLQASTVKRAGAPGSVAGLVKRQCSNPALFLPACGVPRVQALRRCGHGYPSCLAYSGDPPQTSAVRRGSPSTSCSASLSA